MTRKKLTVAEIQHRIADRGITLIGEYVTNRIKTTFRCIAGHEWGARPDDVMQGKGCPHCAGKAPLTAKIVQARIDAHGKGVTMIGEYINTFTKSTFRCVAGHEWETKPLHAMRGFGCPHCAGLAPLTKEIAQARLDVDGRGILMLGKYVNSATRTSFRCSEGHEWCAIPNDVLRRSGCPICAPSGIWQCERAFVYVMDYDHRYTKIGITADPAKRLRKLTRVTSHAVELVALYDTGTGRDAWEMEQTIHRRLRAFNAGLSGFEGASELFHITPATACRLIRKLGGIPAEVFDV